MHKKQRKWHSFLRIHLLSETVLGQCSCRLHPRASLSIRNLRQTWGLRRMLKFRLKHLHLCYLPRLELYFWRRWRYFLQYHHLLGPTACTVYRYQVSCRRGHFLNLCSEFAVLRVQLSVGKSPPPSFTDNKNGDHEEDLVGFNTAESFNIPYVAVRIALLFAECSTNHKSLTQPESFQCSILSILFPSHGFPEIYDFSIFNQPSVATFFCGNCTDLVDFQGEK